MWTLKAGWWIALGWVALAVPALAQTTPHGQTQEAMASKPVARLVSAMMLSDIHLDPFYDPAKAGRLADAPVSQWEGILSSPDSPGRAQAYAVLQKTCGAKGADTSNALFRSSLRAMRLRGGHAAFITVSGDLIAHGFPCRFQTVAPGRTPADYTSFVEKTIEYVMTELRKREPEVPVYASLGNNDSGCGDYRMDAGNDFLRAAAKSMLRGLPASEEKDQALESFSAGGYYSVTMPRPMRGTRLIVLNDLFMSRNYATCAGRADSSAAQAEMIWLGSQLNEARARKQKVWVMGHIPPGVDFYAALQKLRQVCDGAATPMFLSSGKLADALIENADVVRLGIFAHTHMDELRLLEPDGEASPGKMVAVKMVPSITPVRGNRPAFTVAQVNPVTATLEDYTVFVASNDAGTSWSKEYTYSQAYHERAFAPPQVEKLVQEFDGDPGAKTAASKAFISSFYAGDDSGLIKPLWPEYVCALSHMTAQGFSGCACAAAAR
jgi:sphingomyelin phosphodiesterase acid-like 3